MSEDLVTYSICKLSSLSKTTEFYLKRSCRLNRFWGTPLKLRLGVCGICRGGGTMSLIWPGFKVTAKLDLSGRAPGLAAERWCLLFLRRCFILLDSNYIINPTEGGISLLNYINSSQKLIELELIVTVELCLRMTFDIIDILD